MPKPSRQPLLESFDERHDAVIRELDALGAQIDALLVANGVAPQVEAGSPAKRSSDARPVGAADSL